MQYVLNSGMPIQRRMHVIQYTTYFVLDFMPNCAKIGKMYKLIEIILITVSWTTVKFKRYRSNKIAVYYEL